MQQYIIRRVLLFIPTLWLVTLLVFLFLRIIPGDPALLMVGGSTGGGSSFSQEDLEILRHKLGTDRPLHVEYGSWIWDLVRGDLGTSLFYGRPITDQLKVRVPLTLELVALAMLISFVLAVPLGIISALRQDSISDYIARSLSFIGLGVPTFVTGVVTVYLLVRVFEWYPPLVYTPPWEDLSTNLQQLIFPALAIATFAIAFIARVTRSSMLEVLREDFVRTARAKGLRERRVIYLHALRNAFLPILTVGGWAFGVLLAGTVIIESIFLLPGMGRLLLDSISNRDYPLVQGEVFVIAVMVLSLNLVIDLLYAWLDPRIRFK